MFFMIVLDRVIVVTDDPQTAEYVQQSAGEIVAYWNREGTVVECDGMVQMPRGEMVRVVVCDPVLRGVVDMNTELWAIHVPTTKQEVEMYEVGGHGLRFVLEESASDDEEEACEVVHDSLRVVISQSLVDGVDDAYTVFASTQLMARLNVLHHEWVTFYYLCMDDGR
jgi:hypothetical protein